MSQRSESYKTLCAEYYDLDKPTAPEDAWRYYLALAKGCKGEVLEPMCGTGRFLVPLLEEGIPITGFDSSSSMVNLCRKKCKERGLVAKIHEASFETFSSKEQYHFIFIPSGSFCLLTDAAQASYALRFVADYLHRDGKFVFEIITPKALLNQERAIGDQGVWKGSWAARKDGSKIVLHTLSQFNAVTSVETIMCRYELWEKNRITKVEVEEYPLRLYSMEEMELLVTQHGLLVERCRKPFTARNADSDDEVLLFECSLKHRS
jgi:SAM-dependent methyltransferase